MGKILNIVIIAIKGHSKMYKDFIATETRRHREYGKE